VNAKGFFLSLLSIEKHIYIAILLFIPWKAYLYSYITVSFTKSRCR